MDKKGYDSFIFRVNSPLVSHKDHKQHNVTIAVRTMPSPNTADNIAKLVEAILVEWNIPESEIHCILTDNGSNMVAAFKTSSIACAVTAMSVGQLVMRLKRGSNK